jgi:hypothetical protein
LGEAVFRSIFKVSTAEPSMNVSKPIKSHYSEQEAAAVLGLSVDELRTLIKSHIVERDDDMVNVATANFHPSDLLVLRMILAGVKPIASAETTPVPASS